MSLISIIAVLCPIWTPAYLPLVDWPQHLAVISVLANYSDPAFGFEQYLYIDQHLTTYMTFYGGSALLAQIMSVDSAARLMLSLYFIGTPLSLAYLLRGLKRSPLISLLVFPVLFCWPFYYGFISYLLAFPLLFWALGLVVRLSAKISIKDIVILTTVCVLTFFTHALVYLILGLLMLILTLACCRLQWKKTISILSSGILSLVFFSIWITKNYLENISSKLNNILYDPLKDKITAIPGYLNEGFSDNSDKTIAILWLVCLLSIVAIGIVINILQLKKKDTSLGRLAKSLAIPGLIAFLLGTLFFLLPMSAAGIWAISARLVILAAIGLILLVPPLFDKEWQTALLFIPVVALTIWTGLINHKKFAIFDAETTGFNQVVEKTEAKKRVYGLIYNSYSSSMSQPVYLHFPAYYMVTRGGIVGFAFFNNNPSVPIRLKKPATTPDLGLRGEWEPWRFRYDIYGAYYDLLLVRGSANIQYLVGAPKDKLTQLTRQGQWSAYNNTGVSSGEAVYSFLDEVHRAKVKLVIDQKDIACQQNNEQGFRWQCPYQDWSWVGPSLQNFKNVLVPCIWSHPIVEGEILTTYIDPPSSGNVIRGFFGIADSGFVGSSMTRKSPNRFTISINDNPISTYFTNDYRGYQTFELAIPDNLQPIKSISFGVSVEQAAMNHFCYNATLFSEPDK
jgi:hypothetical protein